MSDCFRFTIEIPVRGNQSRPLHSRMAARTYKMKKLPVLSSRLDCQTNPWNIKLDIDRRVLRTQTNDCWFKTENGNASRATPISTSTFGRMTARTSQTNGRTLAAQNKNTVQTQLASTRGIGRMTVHTSQPNECAFAIPKLEYQTGTTDNVFVGGMVVHTSQLNEYPFAPQNYRANPTQQMNGCPFATHNRNADQRQRISNFTLACLTFEGRLRLTCEPRCQQDTANMDINMSRMSVRPSYTGIPPIPSNYEQSHWPDESTANLDMRISRRSFPSQPDRIK